MRGCTLLAVLAGAMACARAEITDIRACGGANEWPPSSYYVRREGQATTEVAGYSPEVLAAALGGSRFRPHVTLLPFARCLADARAGQDIQVVMAAFQTPQRAETFLFSQPYLLLTPRLYFLGEHFPKGITIQGPGDLNALKLCGLNGISYGYLGPASEKVYTGAADYAALVRMLQARRCDAFAESQEVIAGFRMLGVPELSGNALVSAALPDVQPLKVHFAVSRQFKHAADLVADIDKGLERLQREQRLAGMLKRHQTAR
ncbi:substrate-binding periplasmic protein [Piscinibacter terrae]|nr:transporter substrate-binding domain-containing protein [Albitalea terrae]